MLGAGGFAKVFEAFDTNIERPVAIKFLDLHRSLSDPTAAKEVLARFEREAKLAARIEHPNVVNIYDYGLLGRGQTVPEFEDVVLRLEPGLARRPVETRYGFHVVEVVAREGGEPLSYEQVNHLIADYIRERSWRRAVSQYIGQLAADAEIEGVELDVPDSPLVQ
jgi:peptidyl-prolyl cis-trans isomerase C